MWLCTPRGFYAAVAELDGDEYVQPAGIGSRRRLTPSTAATGDRTAHPLGAHPEWSRTAAH